MKYLFIICFTGCAGHIIHFQNSEIGMHDPVFFISSNAFPLKSEVLKEDDYFAIPMKAYFNATEFDGISCKHADFVDIDRGDSSTCVVDTMKVIVSGEILDNKLETMKGKLKNKSPKAGAIASHMKYSPSAQYSINQYIALPKAEPAAKKERKPEAKPDQSVRELPWKAQQKIIRDSISQEVVQLVALCEKSFEPKIGRDYMLSYRIDIEAMRDSSASNDSKGLDVPFVISRHAPFESIGLGLGLTVLFVLTGAVLAGRPD